MASGFGVPFFMKKYQPVKYVARYKCSVCRKESWKVRNSSAQPKNCEGTGCSQVVFPYELERYFARYNCTRCPETWKVRNTSGLAKRCRRCSNMVTPYASEAINFRVTYKCPECENTRKKKKCGSKIEEFPYCSIHRCDMVVESQYETPLQRPPKMNGLFQCQHPCTNRWSSKHSWQGFKQECNVCNTRIMPYQLRPLEQRENTHNYAYGNIHAPHDQARCEMCQFLGYNCKDYRAPIDDTDYEEDDESVMSINSEFGHGGGNSSSSSSGNNTPTNDDNDPLNDSVGRLNELRLNN